MANNFENFISEKVINRSQRKALEVFHTKMSGIYILVWQVSSVNIFMRSLKHQKEHLEVYQVLSILQI